MLAATRAVLRLRIETFAAWRGLFSRSFLPQVTGAEAGRLVLLPARYYHAARARAVTNIRNNFLLAR
jgi:hypothetical protein